MSVGFCVFFSAVASSGPECQGNALLIRSVDRLSAFENLEDIRKSCLDIVDCAAVGFVQYVA